MFKATLTLPTLTPRKVYVGVYGGHFDIAVLMAKKPKLEKGDTCTLFKDDGTEKRSRYYDLYSDEENKPLAIMNLPDFMQLFPGSEKALAPLLQKNGRPLATEVVAWVRMELTAMWDEFGDMVGIEVRAD